eukprot:gene10133-18796_t
MFHSFRTNILYKKIRHRNQRWSVSKLDTSSRAFPTEDTVISTAEEKGPTVTPLERRQLVRSLVNDQLPPSLNEDQNEDHYEPVAHECLECDELKLKLRRCQRNLGKARLAKKKYKEQLLKPLSHRFQERLTQKAAVDKWKAKKRTVAECFPPVNEQLKMQETRKAQKQGDQQYDLADKTIIYTIKYNCEVARERPSSSASSAILAFPSSSSSVRPSASGSYCYGTVVVFTCTTPSSPVLLSLLEKACLLLLSFEDILCHEKE